MVGQFVGDFLIVRTLGQGGFGKVYLGLQAPLYRLQGAVKLIELDQHTDPELLPKVLEKFQGEAEALASMNHPNIVKLLKYGLIQQRPYLVMEYVDQGLTLSDEIHQRRIKGQAVEIDFIVHLITQLLHALEVAHRVNIIHRDIKPDNIMLQDVVGNPSFVRVLDFGLAKFVERSDTTHMAMGTPQYMAPEQLSLKNIGPWTDLYAVGVICYWLLTGQRPFPKDRPEDIIALKLNPKFDPLEPLRERGAPPEVLSFLDDAMAYKTKARIRDVATFHARFEEAMAVLKRLPPEPPQAPFPDDDAPIEVLSSMHILFSAPIESMTALSEEDSEPEPLHLKRSPSSPSTAPTIQSRLRWAVIAIICALFGASGMALWMSQRAKDQTLPLTPDMSAPVLTNKAPDQPKDMAPPPPKDMGPPPERIEAIAQAHQPIELALDAALAARDHAQRVRVVDVAPGKFHTCALISTGQVRCWGGNFHGELGLGHADPIGDDESPNSSPWLSLGQPARAVVAAGDRNAAHTCALLVDGNVRCWGSNQFGQLGLGHTNPVGQSYTPAVANTVELGASAQALTVGASQYGSHTCALLEGGEVRCWGDNRYGQLGLGHTQVIGDNETPASTPKLPLPKTVTQIVAGKYHTCALLKNHDLMCWGFNDKGQLGLGHTKNIGDDEPIARAAKLPLRGTPVSVAAGRQHTCALLKDASVRCWGWNNKGQLGLGDTKDRGDDESIKALPAISLGQDATSITAGDMHTCALLADGNVRCWGSNQFGQLGLNHDRHIGDDEAPSSQATIMLGRPATSLRAGSYHTCALLDDDSVRCWGLNSFGQLGLGHTQTIGDDETPASGPPVAIMDAAP